MMRELTAPLYARLEDPTHEDLAFVRVALMNLEMRFAMETTRVAVSKFYNCDDALFRLLSRRRVRNES